jgi:hypothetical protein
MMLKISLLLAATLSSLEAKVSIFAHYFGQPEFVKYQHLFFQRNLLDDYEFVIFEDSNDPDISNQIRLECEKYSIPYHHIPSHVFEQPKLPIKDEHISLNAPSFQCAVATQYIYDNYVVPSKDICLILDNDIFLLSPISIEKHLGDHSFAYSKEERGIDDQHVFYMLPNFVLFNPARMPEKERLDFNMGTILETNTDSGGYTYFYLLHYHSLGKELPKYYLYEIPSPLRERFGSDYPLLFNSEEWRSHCFVEKDTFLHIRMGSNWSKHPKYTQMTEELTSLFDRLLNDSGS